MTRAVETGEATRRSFEGAGQASRLVVFAADSSASREAEDLALRLGVDVVFAEASARAADLHLRMDVDGLSLASGDLSMRGDFSRMLPRLKPGRLHQELLVRAAKLKKRDGAGNAPVAVDATAGLGEDSLLLAAAGFEVLLVEYNAVIAALLRDALRRAADDLALSDAVSRMRLVEGDSVHVLGELAAAPDVVLLDPMFPVRTKSAAVKKKFQLLHLIEQPCADEDSLLRAAIAAHPRKIIVKRPPKGPYLADVKPAYSLAGKAVRYDVIVSA